MKIKFSIIIPIYNCQNNLELFIIKTVQKMSLCSSSFEIILIDDGSMDKSWDILKSLKNKYKKIKIFKNKKNIGQHPSIIKGLSHSKGESIFIMDGDFQDDPKYFNKFINKKKNNNTCVFGLVHTNNEKGYLSYLFWTIFSYLTNIDKNYRSTSFCLIAKSSAIKLLKLKKRGFIYGDLYKLNEKIEFITYRKNKKIKNSSGYTYLRLILFGLKILSFYIFTSK
ncbi:glycosyltransferase [Candidatus Pelagibacter bacterium]|nr:glycosyltransferase [Candidatus Pelagibacter bacterium]